nr:MAG TPA: Receptor Binding Protein [Caudoviricetes sp.]
MKWLHGRTSGVFGADGNLSVTANGDMTVSVSDGVGWLANDKADGTVFWNDTKEQTGSELQLAISLADAVSPRIDRVVVSWDTVDYAAKPRIEVLKGTAASTPAAPALTNNSLLRQISLAQIAIPAAASKITADNITDERLDSTVCGLVTDWVSVDTHVMQQQFAAFLTKIETELNQLQEGTATMLRATYDPQGRQSDIFKSIDGTAALYIATLTLDGWEACTGTDLTNGYLYKQTATLTPDNSAAPAVTADSTFVSGVQFTPTGVAATDETLADVLNIINDGRTVSGAGNVTVYVTEKPAAEIHARWAITT